MGDEVRRTQAGNNNAYCQDNAISWFDWTLVEQHADVHRFVTLLNARRLLRSIEHERQRLTLEQLIRQASKAVLVLVLAGATDLAQNVEGPVDQHLHAHQVMAPSRRRAAIVCSRPRVVRPPACISRRAAARLRGTQTSGGRLGRRCRASPRNLAEVRETLESDLGSAQ
jgi:hypothetical protein